MKNYDVNFDIAGLACFVIEAENQDAAFEEAERVLENMSKEEVIRRLTDALDFCGTTIHSVVELDS